MNNRAFEPKVEDDHGLVSSELDARCDAIATHKNGSGCPVARSEVGEGYWLVNCREDSASLEAGEERPAARACARKD